MYKLKPGWTKEMVIEKIKKYNNGTVCSEGCLCRYEIVDQDGNTNRCAIGCFIPDGHQALESFDGVEDILDEYPELKDYMPFEDKFALEAFQAAHDAAKEISVHARIEDFLKERVES